MMWQTVKCTTSRVANKKCEYLERKKLFDARKCEMLFFNFLIMRHSHRLAAIFFSENELRATWFCVTLTFGLRLNLKTLNEFYLEDWWTQYEILDGFWRNSAELFKMNSQNCFTTLRVWDVVCCMLLFLKLFFGRNLKFDGERTWKIFLYVLDDDQFDQ